MPEYTNLKSESDSQSYEIAIPEAYELYAPPVTERDFLGALEREDVREPVPERSWDDTGKTQPEWDEEKKEFRSSGTEKIKDEKGPREKRAIWIVHGMGQQIPFETLDSLTHGLLGAAQRLTTKNSPRPRLRTVRLGAETLQRVELDLNGKSGRSYELHLYESYWAPKTEGVARLGDVISFLWDGGTRGLLNCASRFCRAMFGGMESFRIHITTPIFICTTLLVLLALTVINGVIVAAGVAQSKMVFGSRALSGHWAELAALASCMTGVAFTFGSLLFLADLSKPSTLHRVWRVVLKTVTWMGLAATIAAIVGTALLMMVIMRVDSTSRPLNDTGATIYYHGWAKFIDCAAEVIRKMPTEHLQGFATLLILCCLLLVFLAMMVRAILGSLEKKLRGNGLLLFLFFLSFVLTLISILGPPWLWGNYPLWSSVIYILKKLGASTFWVWPFLIALSAKIRTLMIQFVGDVAIYVTPNKLNRFEEARNKIKETARNVASSVYLARNSDKKNFLYQNVAVVGHSLGSVIAYDTLNRLMLDDWLSRNYLRIAQRTNALVTFGSPLNKTAFFFTIQSKDELRVRERLAATVQPLIQSYYKFRKLRWINVYSGSDIISGKLTFYDLRKFQEPNPIPSFAVQNVVDEDAVIPLVAHVDYWKNETVWNELFQQIAP